MTSSRWARFKRWMGLAQNTAEMPAAAQLEALWQEKVDEGHLLYAQGQTAQAGERYAAALTLMLTPFLTPEGSGVFASDPGEAEIERLSQTLQSAFRLNMPPSSENIQQRRVVALVLVWTEHQYSKRISWRVKHMLKTYATSLFKQAVEINRAHGKLDTVSTDYLQLAELASSELDYRRQWDYLQQVFTLAETRASERAVSDLMRALLSLSHLTLNLGNPKDARSHAERALHIARQLKQPASEASALWTQALIAMRQGNTEQAQQLRAQVLEAASQQNAEAASTWDTLMEEKLTRLAHEHARLALEPDPPPAAKKGSYPRHSQDSRYWDRFWRKRSLRFWMEADFFDDTGSYIPALQQRGCKRILVAGNGVSLEPRALAQASFAVTALDLSAYATETAASTTITTDQLRRFSFFRGMVEIEINEAADHKVAFVTGSLFDRTICSGPYDCIIIRRTLQYFEGPDLRRAIEALLARLSPTGVLIIHAHNNYPSLDAAATALHLHRVGTSRTSDLALVMEVCPNRQVAWLRGSSG